jgi:hypothetical protein
MTEKSGLGEPFFDPPEANIEYVQMTSVLRLIVIDNIVLSLFTDSAAIDSDLGHGRVAIDRYYGLKSFSPSLAQQLGSFLLGTTQNLLISIRFMDPSSSRSN